VAGLVHSWGMACNEDSMAQGPCLLARVAVVLILLVVSLGLLAGCGEGSSPDSKSEHGPSRPGGLVAACAQISVARVATLVREAGGRPVQLRRRAGGSTALSRCSFKSPGVNVELSLDANQDAERGYFNRMTELSQFGSRSADLRPQPVPGIGDRGTSGYGANWVASFDQLFSVRRGQALIATFYVREAPLPRLRAGAIAVSRLAYAALGSPRRTR
jgi:hypothetical protein